MRRGVWTRSDEIQERVNDIHVTGGIAVLLSYKLEISASLLSKKTIVNVRGRVDRFKLLMLVAL